MRATITSKGQVTIPQKIREKLNLKPGQVLEFDEAAPFLKATKAFDPREMYSVIGCCADAGPNLVAEEWLRETRGLVELPHDKHANGN
jgi:AbrB family looped-hinge helix DNA binding protein